MITQRAFLGQLFLLQQDMDHQRYNDTAHAEQVRQMWASRLKSLLSTSVDPPLPTQELRTNAPDVIDCMGSVPECANNGCQFRKTAGYRPGEGPVFTS